jgi:agmatine deiminase
MPAEWAPHTRTWVAWPPKGNYLREDGSPLQAWAAVARAVAEFEPVTVVVPPALTEEARSHLGPELEFLEAELDDAWIRDSGPTFVVDDAGTLGAVHWTFNGWGRQPWARWEHDARVGRTVAEHAGARVIGSRLVNEGGAICVDGEGTVLVTETVQLHDRRNPDWSREQVEAELRDRLGVDTVIWLARGLTADMQGFGTNGHVDVMAAFVRPGVVVVHGQPDSDHPDHAVMVENVARLRAATDARGRALEIVTVDAPKSPVVDGVPMDYSYINFSFVNGGLVLCSFADPAGDAAAVETFARLFPDRRITTVDARDIFARGGGIHCITAHQPATR